MNTLTGSPALKLQVMCEGIRYTPALGAAAAHSMPNYYPYRFKPGEPDPGGRGIATIPYLINTADGTEIRILGDGDSPWHVEGDAEHGYTLIDDRNGQREAIGFEPLRPWLTQKTDDGLPYAQAGVTTHGDMLVINVAPGCEYFLHKHDGVSMRCTFCAYGAPDERTLHLGQKTGQVGIPQATLDRMAQACEAVCAQTEIRHIYLVGGSLTDARKEGERFLQLARYVQRINHRRIPVALGSGAIPDDLLERFHAEQLVQHVCFNLEQGDAELFAKICPGKNRYVGYARWIESLETAVRLWGRGHVYTAMVAGIELEPEHGLEWEDAARRALAGAEDLCRRGIVPVYSLVWPVGGRQRPDFHARIRNYFETLVFGCRDIRRRHALTISEGFMCHRCAYMQLECDLERVGELVA
ncbi:MAG: hypothetical protein KGL18_12140 [Burkholderiales bacterium]|nr:hypothetical protein [Burkholderiales bacterium]MDE1928497.1 hypothetical protein [Burkholderiales bacterium]MDE2159796.1 hypothetical protein [Burkholderiales bacterium]MDE2503707.1 hypothetical protein [Burkholderiales bacterium]